MNHKLRRDITWFNNPGFNQIGENNYGTFYLANLWDGKAVKLNVSIKYVANIVTIPLAGEEHKNLPHQRTCSLSS